MGILIYLVSVADSDGNVQMSYSDIGNALGYQKMKVMRCLRKLQGMNAVVTLPLRSRYTKTAINVCNIEYYKKGVTLPLHCSYGADTVKRTSEGKTEKKKSEPLSVKSEEAFASKVYEYKGQYDEKMLQEFIDYWTERNENGIKMRFEKEKTFDISRRLVRWHKNNYGSNTGLPVERKMQQDGTILHAGQMDYTKGGW